MVIPKLTMEPKQNTAINFFPSYSVQGFSYDEKIIKFLKELKNNPLRQTWKIIEILSVNFQASTKDRKGC